MPPRTRTSSSYLKLPRNVVLHKRTLTSPSGLWLLACGRSSESLTALGLADVYDNAKSPMVSGPVDIPLPVGWLGGIHVWEIDASECCRRQECSSAAIAFDGTLYTWGGTCPQHLRLPPRARPLVPSYPVPYGRAWSIWSQSQERLLWSKVHACGLRQWCCIFVWCYNLR